MDANLEAALMCCISDDGPAFADNPFGLVVDGRPVRVATNGRVLLMVDDCRDGDHDISANLAAWRIIEKCSGPSTHSAPRAALNEWAGKDRRTRCPECEGGMLNAKKCRKCNGDGVVYCSLDEEHECKACRGDGVVGDKCGACDGSGYSFNDIAEIFIPALSIAIDAHCVGGIFAILPGDEVGIHSVDTRNHTLCVFRGPRWMLAVSGLTRADWSLPGKICLNARPIEDQK